MSDEVTTDTLPFNAKKQDAILGHCLTDPKFFLQARNLILPSWFSQPHSSIVYQTMLDWYTQYGRPGTPEEIINSPRITAEAANIRPKLVAKIRESIFETSNFKLDALTNELTMWLRARIFYGGMHAAQKIYNAGRLEESYVAMNTALKEIKEASFSKEREASFANWRADFDLTKAETQRGLTFGLKTVDDLLFPTNMGGSLFPGDTTIILAPTNVGKTTTMITTLTANIKNGKRILFLTHEGRPRDIQQKLWQCFLGKTVPELYQMPMTDEGVAELDHASHFLGRFLTYVPYNKAGLTIEDVEPLIRRKQEDLMARNNGKGYDMLVCDYPAKLTSKMAAGGHMSKRNIDEIVYGYFIQLALEYNFHSLLAIQTNREGSKVNKGQKDDGRLLVMEDVHESYGVMMEATNVITLNRNQVAKARRHMTFYLDKSRSSETGFAVVARTDYARARTHGNELGSIWYRGSATAGDTVDDLLNNPASNGQEIDVTQL
jgi:replicative DNA helicase